MLKNYIKVAFRTLIRHRLFSIINIVGLAVGLAGCLLILAVIRNEMSFEDCHRYKDRIYRVGMLYQTGGSTLPGACVMPALGTALREQCPEVEEAVRFRYLPQTKVKIDDQRFKDISAMIAEPELFDIFTITAARGNPADLAAPNTVFLSESLSRRFFGDNDPVGRSIRFMNLVDLRVIGVYRDIPANTQIRSDMIGSYSSLKEFGIDTETWGSIGEDYIYLLMRPDGDPTVLTEKIMAMVNENLEPEIAKRFTLFLQPLPSIYLHSSLSWELQPTGDTDTLYLFAIVTLLILTIACVNFINLTTARVAHRMKEVGMRKVAGAMRSQLIYQFLGESVLLAGMATVLGLSLFEIGRPSLEAYLGRALVVNIWSDPLFSAAIVFITIIVGVVAGSYPAFHLSRIDPIENLRGRAFSGPARARLRRGLVVFQFIIAVGLIFLTIAIQEQVDYFQTTDKGFDTENIIAMQIDDEIETSRAMLLRDRLINSGVVVSATAMGAPPCTHNMTITYIKPENKLEEDARVFQLMYADINYPEVFGLQITQGAGLRIDEQVEGQREMVVMESVLEEFEIENPLGFRLVGEESEFTIVGVIKDYAQNPLTAHPLATGLVTAPDDYHWVAAKLFEGDRASQIAAIGAIWAEVIPEYPFDYSYLDDVISEEYRDEERMGMLFTVFAFLAMLIACLGIFALSSFAAERRTREVGIRKALGASISSIIGLLSKEFLVLVAVANVIAWPIAWYILNKWLESYAQRMPITWTLFAMAALISLFIALLTVSYTSIRASRNNPVDVLRHE